MTNFQVPITKIYSIKRFWKLSKGFTIIELLIVMSLLGIAATLVSTAYLSFEKRERVKSAALDLKSNLRLAQNKALSGDKGIPNPTSSNFCTESETLVGWYLRFEQGFSAYDIRGACQISPGNERNFLFKTINLPEGVSLLEMHYYGDPVFFADFDLWTVDPINILFRPLEHEVYAFYGFVTPPFYNSDGDISWAIIANFMPDDQQSIKLVLDGYDTQFEVNIFTNGEINEKKI